jgi:hypothetical protein
LSLSGRRGNPEAIVELGILDHCELCLVVG